MHPSAWITRLPTSETVPSLTAPIRPASIATEPSRIEPSGRYTRPPFSTTSQSRPLSAPSDASFGDCALRLVKLRHENRLPTQRISGSGA